MPFKNEWYAIEITATNERKDERMRRRMNNFSKEFYVKMEEDEEASAVV